MFMVLGIKPPLNYSILHYGKNLFRKNISCK